ncbi:MAG: hypothetical protein ABEJ26_01770 [Halosimplex sp.]
MALGTAVGAGARDPGGAASAGVAGVGWVVAHAGTTHAGTPHWVLGALTLVGLVAAVGGWRVLRDADASTRLGVGLVAAGVLAVIAGGIGLVEIQIAPRDAPAWTEWFDAVNAAVSVLLAVGSLAVVRRRWPERPRYVGLGLLLAAWIGYPSLMPDSGLSNPLGYPLAVAVPVAVGYLLYRDAGDGLRRVGGARLPAALSDLRSAVVAGVSFVLFAVFFAFSAGTMTLAPDVTAEIAGEGFVRTYVVASPLVYWPAVEFYVPSIPLSGYVSVGTVLLVGLLGGLVALNAALVARQWEADGAVQSPRAMVGTVAASGATACCCCAPALYGALGVVLGAAASPVYWAFMDPSSPVGGLFFAASVLVLTGSAIRASHDPACAIPRDPDASGAAERAA